MPKDIFESEEILVDWASQGDLSLETPIKKRAIEVLRWVVLGILLIFAFRLVYLTVFQSAILQSAAEQSRQRVSFIAPLRGLILDDQGKVLVGNKAVFQLVFDPLRARVENEQDREKNIEKAAVLLSLGKEDLDGMINPFLNQAEPRVIIPELTSKQAVALNSSDISDFLFVQSGYKRDYPLGGLNFAHVLGYVGSANQQDMKLYNLWPGASLGKAGVEQSYDDVLRGQKGEKITIVDALGRPQGEPAVTKPKAGENLQLTIDSDLTDVTFKALRHGIDVSGASGGSAVIIDVKTGAVKALISLPSYDPASFAGGGLSQKDYASLVSNPNKPFLNRAIAGLYPSGSTVKPFIAAAALAENIISPGRVIETHGFITVPSIYDPAVSWTFRDWKNHGPVNMIEAIARSVDVYFYTIGGGYGNVGGLGAEKIGQYLSDFNFGKALGIDLSGEVSGFIPTPEWKKNNIGESWYIGDTYNFSIGQGYFQVTPLQLAVATAAIANGGNVVWPHVADAVLAQDNKVIKKIEPKVISKVPIPAADLEISRQGMRASVSTPHGTNISLAGLPISVAAKTGTAQFGNAGRTHALVTAFAPYENPEIAMAVVMDGGGEGTASTHVARDILTWYANHH